MPIGEGKQLPLWNFNLRYVHVMRAMFDSGEVAEMGSASFLCWVCLRTYSDFNTGIAYPSLETLSQKLGQTVRTTQNQIKVLVKMGYVEKNTSGGKNYYRIIDKFKAEEMTTGNDETEMSMPYIPQTFADKMSALKDFRSNKITPRQLAEMGIEVDMPQQVQNFYMIVGDNNRVTTNQVIVQKQGAPEFEERLTGKKLQMSIEDNREVLRQLIEQRDSTKNSMERGTAERWIEVVRKQIIEAEE